MERTLRNFYYYFYYLLTKNKPEYAIIPPTQVNTEGEYTTVDIGRVTMVIVELKKKVIHQDQKGLQRN